MFAIAMYANRFGDNRHLLSIGGRYGSLLYHLKHLLQRCFLRCYHGAGAAAGREAAIGGIAAVGKYFAAALQSDSPRGAYQLAARQAIQQQAVVVFFNRPSNGIRHDPVFGRHFV